MARDVAIDLGSANTLAYQRGRGTLFSEPTVLALDKESGAVLAMGQAAWSTIASSPGYVVAVRPLRSGAISDFDITQTLIQMVLQRAGRSRLSKPRVLVSVATGLTEVERRAVEGATLGAGARSCYLIEQPIAAAIGAGLPIHEPLGNLVVDVGGGTTEIALISMGAIVTNRAIAIGGFDLDLAIQSWVRQEYGMSVGERTAERLKIAIGSAFPLSKENRAELKGRDLASGEPRAVFITSDEVRDAIKHQVRAIVDAVTDCLASSPPDLVQDVQTNGITLTGGGAMLKGLDMLLSEEVDVAVHVTDEPLHSVVVGAGRCLDSLDDVKPFLVDTTR